MGCSVDTASSPTVKCVRWVLSHEREPDVKSSGGAATAEDLVTQYVAYYRNDKGGIGLYSWVNDTQLEDLEDYQARRLRRCTKCGAVEPTGREGMPEGLPGAEGMQPLDGASRPLPGPCPGRG